MIKKYFLYILISQTFYTFPYACKQEPLSDITFVLLGASGDLATRDLIPALFRLYREKQLEHFTIIGAALPSADKNYIIHQSQQFIQEYNEQEWNNFIQHFYYVSVDFTQQNFKQLNNVIQQIEHTYGLSGNRLIYCATSCDFFIPITQTLVKDGIITKQFPSDALAWHRIAYEKPFGYDSISAHHIESCITDLLDASQIFHIDHFLMTHVMNFIPALHLKHTTFEHQWNKDHIKKVDILCKETLSVGNRGKFYDAVGSLLDVVQNHMFQMLALVAMEKPLSNNSESLHHERAHVIRNTEIRDGFLGQYNGYTQEINVPADSTTDTFSFLHIMVNTPRWQEVPFYLVAGKHLDVTEICIRITFKSEDQLTLWIAPQPKIEIFLQRNDSAPLHLTYDYPIDDSYSTDTYKKILVALCNNDRSIHVSFKEIDAAWDLIKKIKEQKLPFYMYEKSSVGPVPLTRVYKTWPFI